MTTTFHVIYKFYSKCFADGTCLIRSASLTEFHVKQE